MTSLARCKPLFVPAVARPTRDLAVLSSARSGSVPVDAPLQELTTLALEVQGRRALEDLLQVVVDRSARLVDADHASIRLLDPSGTRLVAACRTGEPVHLEPLPFERGEGLLGWIAEHGRPIRAARPQDDPRFVERPAMKAMGPFLGVPLVSGSSSLGVLSALRDEGPFDERDEQLLILVAAICAPYLEIARLSRLSEVDPLTGTLNRRGLDAAFPDTLGDGQTLVEPLSVVMVDLDHFKQINDTHGHAVGDEVLRHVSRLLSQVLRSGDAIVRYGGEEFLLILPEVGLGRALRIAERARSAVERHPLRLSIGQVSATISLGVAERGPGESRASLIGRADQALYAAKTTGRNKIVAADELAS